MRRQLVPVALLVMLSACERVVDITLPPAPVRLVVEARLERVQGALSGQQTIRLSTTGDFFGRTTPPPATGATVSVRIGTQTAILFTESSAVPGEYTATGLIVEANREYTLSILYAGERYASTERMATVAPIDSLYFARRAGLDGPSEGMRATINFVDPPGKGNYYIWEQFIDGKRLLSSSAEFIFRLVISDELFDGNDLLGVQPYDGIVVPKGATARVRQIGLTPSLGRYFIATAQQTSNNASPFGLPPASVRGNVRNVADVSKPALGYFSVSEVSERSAKLP